MPYYCQFKYGNGDMCESRLHSTGEHMSAQKEGCEHKKTYITDDGFTMCDICQSVMEMPSITDLIKNA